MKRDSLLYSAKEHEIKYNFKKKIYMCLYTVYFNGDLCEILAVIKFSGVLSTKQYL